MPFTTKLDFTNRQAKQYEATGIKLSGSSCFGLCYSALTSGLDTTTTGVSESYTTILSTFSGNTGSTVYTWSDSRMSLGASALSALTPSNSALTQNTGDIFVVSSSTIIDGNTVNLAYTGVSFDIDVVGMISLGGGAYSGSVTTDLFDVLSGGSLDYTGRTIWVDVSGITRTKELIVSNACGSAAPTPGHVLTCLNSEGMVYWAENSSGGTGTFTGNTSASCITDLWITNLHGCSPITIHDEVQANGSSATGTTSIAYGNTVSAFGNYSQAWGDGSIAYGYASHAEGENTVANGTGAHAEGQSSSATSESCHAEGSSTFASGTGAHAEGGSTFAIDSYAHAEGFGGTASGSGSHAEGWTCTASGIYSHAEGSGTVADGGFSHAEGRLTTVNATGAHVGGSGNTIIVTSDYSSIVGGRNNLIDSNFGVGGTAYDSFIGGGENNDITEANRAVILGGDGNSVSADYSAIVGGSGNSVTGERIVILGGEGIVGTSPDTVYVPDLNIKDGKGISFGTGSTKVYKEIQIGDWDMDATSAVTVTHNLTATEWKTVRSIGVTIRNDGDTAYYVLDNMVTGTPTTNIDSTNINLARDLSGDFDNTGFDSTGYNRGFINFWYTPD